MIQTTFHCDGCGQAIAGDAPPDFFGTHHGQLTAAAGGVHGWHTCSAKCCSEYLRKLADKVELRGAELAAARKR